MTGLLWRPMIPPRFMNPLYHSAIAQEARRRGIAVEMIDAATPLLVLSHRGRVVRCCQTLTDRVGAVSFQLAQDKRLANQYLARYGFPVPRQIRYGRFIAAQAFLEKYRSVVVKPCREAEGRGLSLAVRTVPELRRAILRARKFGKEIVMEPFLEGINRRVVIVDDKLAAAVEREAAFVIGNGSQSLRELIRQKNARLRKLPAAAAIPLNAKTRRDLMTFGLDYSARPRKGKKIQIRRLPDPRAGGTIRDIADTVSAELAREARKIARLFRVPVMAVDFLVNPRTGRHWVIGVNPDLPASSPAEARAVSRVIDFLFPRTKPKKAPRK